MGKAVDLRGQNFDRLKAIRPTKKRDSSGSIIWECLCSCGNTAYVPSRALTRKEARSCGCLKTERLAERTKRDLTDMQFDRLKAIRPTEERRRGSIVWECECRCGKTVKVSARSLISGNTRSCGCLNHEVQKSSALKKAEIDNVEGTRLSYLSKTTFSNNKSGRRGVHFRKDAGKWSASIGFKGVKYYLGLFENFDDAVWARETAENVLWWPFVEKQLGKCENEAERKERLSEYFRIKISNELYKHEGAKGVVSAGGKEE